MTKALQLFLFRHAKSSWDQPDLTDHDRPLNDRGINAASLMGTEMAKRALAPELVVCSTSRRTRQTLDLWLAASKIKPDIIFAENLYHASPSVMLDIVKKTTGTYRGLMLLGHNPGMEQFAMQLSADLSSKSAKAMMEKFPTAALAVFDLPNKNWADTEPGTGELISYLMPRQIMSEREFAKI